MSAEPEAADFELRNVGAGPDPFSLAAIADEVDFAVLLLQRDHYCTNCRQQVQDVAARYDEFRERDAEVVSIVPEPLEKVHEWQASYDLPFPLLSDPETVAGDAYDQPVRFGTLGNMIDLVGRMPEAVVVDLRGGVPSVAWTHKGDSTWDRPTIDDLLGELDRLREQEPAHDRG